MGECSNIDAPWLVGDPVDVLRGAVVERSLDARSDADVGLRWHRYYNSADRDVDRGLGWGHTHGLDHSLTADLDGWSHRAPSGDITRFPPLEHDGACVGRGGWSLVRHTARTYGLTHPSEGAWVFEVDQAGDVGHPVRRTLGDDTLTLTYRDGVLARVTGWTGRRVDLDRDTHGRITALRDGQRSLVRYRYDRDGNLAELTDRYGATMRFEWVAQGLLARRVERTGMAWTWRYDAANRCISATGEGGLRAVRLRYQGEHTEVTLGDGGRWIYRRGSEGELAEVQDPYGGVQKYVRDETGKITQEIDARGCVTWIRYDTAGGVAERVSPAGERGGNGAGLPRHAAGWEHGWRVVLPPPRTRIERDDAGLRVRELRDGRVRTWRYDPGGNVVRYTDLEGSTWRHTYAGANHRVSTTDPLGNVTTYARDAEERLTEVIDPRGNRHGYAYDLRGALVTTVRDGVVRERLVRDTGGALTARVDREGIQRLAYGYDARGCRTERRLGSGDVQRMRHDTRGRLLGAVSSVGEQAMAYDAAGRTVLDERDGVGVRSRWGEAGVAETWVLGRFVTRYERMQDGTSVVVDPTGTTHRVSQPVVGVVVRELACGWTERSTWDDRGRCQEKLVFPRERPDRVHRRSYAWTPEGNLAAVTDSAVGVTAYTHDAAHRLASETLPDGTHTTYGYDAASNLVAAPSLGVTEAGAGNRLRAGAGAWLAYDARGRLCAREEAGGTWRYGYDARDQLVEATRPGVCWTAAYDVLGRRVRRVVNGTVSTFWWDGDRLAAELIAGVLRVLVYADEGALTPLLVVAYDNPEADPRDGRRYYLHADHRGAPTMVRDDSGAVVWRARLDPYGCAHVDVGVDFDQPLRFPGHYYDAATGLHDNRFRTYCPRLGRYLQPDPLGLRGGLNLYAYTSNPLRRVDLRGLMCPEGPSADGPVEPAVEDDIAEESLPPVAGVGLGDTERNPYDPDFGLGDRLWEQARRSPRLARALDMLMCNLWRIHLVQPDGVQHSECRRRDRTIVVVADASNDAEILGALAHEVGHSEYPDPGELTTDDPDALAAARQLDEDHAVIFNSLVRDDLGGFGQKVTVIEHPIDAPKNFDGNPRTSGNDIPSVDPSTSESSHDDPGAPP